MTLTKFYYTLLLVNVNITLTKEIPMNATQFDPAASFFRIATATPEAAIGDVRTNVARISTLFSQAAQQHISLVVFPELSITGYSLGDVVRQQTLLASAQAGLLSLAAITKNTQTAMVVGLPLAHKGRLYNCAAIVAKGEVQAIVTKTNLPNYGEFYEQRWYQSFTGTDTHIIAGKTVPFGQHILADIGGVLVGTEICEDMWVADQPSKHLTAAGAEIIVNPSASPELVGKSAYRKELVRMTSAVQRAAYVYAGADWTESTTDIVMSGHAIIAENGSVLAERTPFTTDERLLVADIDIEHLRHDRLQDTTYAEKSTTTTIVETSIKRTQPDCIRRVPTSYFLPAYETSAERTARLERIFAIQAHGFAARLKAVGSQTIVLGLSGGLDSTLALLVARRAVAILGKQPSAIHAITMPGPASSNRTQSNAVKLANALGVTSLTIPIGDVAAAERAALKHDGTQDITYENIQARARTAILFNYANSNKGIVLGTGDLSELALGWCTFGGDHLNHYNVNGSIPKTLIRDLVTYAGSLPDLQPAEAVIADIVATPISPELTKQKGKALSQETESLIGPYVLHDFFIFHVLRYGDAPAKISYLATKAFTGTYSKKEIEKWLSLFYERFASNQFKRSVMPDGPKVGSIALSPRGDWRMPSDMHSAVWTDVFAVQ